MSNRPTMILIQAVLALTCSCGLWAATLVVDNQHPQADDGNIGSEEAPFRTINAAAAKAQPGDVVLVQPGVYREAVRISVSGRPGEPIVFKSATPHAAVVSGSDPVTDWTAEGPGVWSAPAPAAKYNKYDQEQWVYVDGYPAQRAGDLSQLLPGMFYLDYDRQRVYLAPGEGVEPKELLVEFASRQGLFSVVSPQTHQLNSVDDIHIVGFKIVHNADWWRGLASIQASGSRWLIEGNHIAWSSCRGIGVGGTNSAVIRNNRVEWSGQLAIGGGRNYNLLVENNQFLYSNWRRFRPSWEAGGSKFAQTLDSRIRGNTWAYSYGWACWFDITNEANIMQENVIHDVIAGAGLFSEISWNDIIRDNIIYNSDQGICIGESPATVVHRNIVFNNKTGVRVRGDFRREAPASKAGSLDAAAAPEEAIAGIRGIPGMDPDRVERWMANYLLYWVAPRAHMTNNCAIWENVIFANGANYSEHRNYGEPSATDPFINNHSDFNIIHSADPSSHFVHARGRYEGLAHWQKVSGRDAHSREIDPVAAFEQLPEWVKAKRSLWQMKLRPYSDLQRLNLGLIESPASSIVTGRILRSANVEELRLSNPQVKAFVFDVDGQRTLGLWSTQMVGRHHVRLNLGQQRVTVENGYLGQKQVALVNGAIDVPVTWIPTYLRGVGETIEQIESGLLDVQTFNAPDQPVPLSITFSNTTSQPQELDVTLASTAGFTPEPGSIRRALIAGEKVQLQAQLVSDGSVRSGGGQVRVTAALGAETMIRTGSFVIGGSSGKIPSLGSVNTMRRIYLDGKLNDWGDIIERVPLGVISDASHIISGDKVAWSGPADLNASIYAAWRDGELLVGVVVKDDVVVPSPSGTDPWTNDAVEIFIDGRSAEMQFQVEPTEGCYQIGVSPGKGNVPTNVKVFEKTLEGLKAATTLTDDGYIVEVSIPLNEKNFPAAGFSRGRAIKMSVLINDRDAGEGKDNVLGWGASPDGRNYRDTSGWHVLTLEP